MELISRVNKSCTHFPCHKKLEDCIFCYCPLYPCEIEDRGKYLENGYWDCSNCDWPHQKERVDKIFNFLYKNWIRE
jgi:Zn-finger protein